MDLKGSVALVTDGNDRLEQRCGRLDILVNDAFDKSELPTKDDCADMVVTMCRSKLGQTAVIDSGRLFSLTG